MSSWRQQLTAAMRRNPRIALLVFLLLGALGIAIYQMATAFSRSSDAPEYERSPAPGLAPPVAVSIASDEYFTGISNSARRADLVRLPDTDMVFLFGRVRQLGQQLGPLLARQDRGAIIDLLIEQGMSRSQARTATDDLLQALSGYSAIDVLVSKNWALAGIRLDQDGVVDKATMEGSMEVTAGSQDQGVAEGNLNLTFFPAERDGINAAGRYKLTDLTASVGG